MNQSCLITILIKQKLETKILINLAISKLVNQGDKVNLVVGMPIEHWLDREDERSMSNL